jgi:hypothetical protein
MSGRKERWGPEAYAAVIKDIAAGVPLALALGGKDRPGRTSFYARLKEDAELSAAYDQAMQSRADVRIADLLDVNTRLLEGRIDPQSAKVVSENLRWLSSRENPRLYGDVAKMELTGRDGKDLLQGKAEISDFELARLVSYIMCKGQRPEPIDGGELVAIENEAST